MEMRASMAVDLVTGDGGTGGISRYVERMQGALADLEGNVRRVPFRYLPGAQRRTVLKALPVGIVGSRAGAVTHIPQIMGASILLLARVRPVVVTVHDLGALYCPEDRAMGDRIGHELLRL